jgi:hypothetical protein
VRRPAFQQDFQDHQAASRQARKTKEYLTAVRGVKNEKELRKAFRCRWGRWQPPDNVAPEISLVVLAHVARELIRGMYLMDGGRRRAIGEKSE